MNHTPKMDILTHPSKPAFLSLNTSILNTITTTITTLIPAPYFHILITFLTIALPILLSIYIHRDYKSFLSLGPGGTPPTPLGYLKIKALSIISLRDPLRPIAIPPHYRPQTGYLTNLPVRAGERPLIRGIAPQRQQSEKSSKEVYAKLVEQLRTLAHDPENLLIERTSCFEKHSSGLFSRAPITRTCGGEICHVHPSDGSLHLILHPADIRILIESGRGERHPLAKGGWFRRFVPKEFVTVYAPRNEEEVDVVMQIVRASIWWVSGMDVSDEKDGEGNEEKKDDWAKGQQEVEKGKKIKRERQEEKVCWVCKKTSCARVRKGEMIGDA